MPAEQGWQELILVGVASAVLGGVLVAVITFFGRRHWQAYEQDRQEERLLRAFLEMATEANPHEKLTVPLFAPKAAARAKIRDPDPVLNRLVSKHHIRQFPEPYQDYYNLTPPGRQRAYDLRPSHPSLWQLLSGK